MLLVSLSLLFALTQPPPLERAYVSSGECTLKWTNTDTGRALLRRFLAPYRAIIKREGCRLLLEGMKADFQVLRGAGLTVEAAPVEASQKLDGTYSTWGEIGPYLVSLAGQSEGLAVLELLGFSGEGLPLYMVSLGDDPSHPLIRITGAHHGNEIVSVENALGILEFLLSAQGAPYRSLFRFQVIPVLNPEGYKYDQRYNGVGMDLNRDYGFGWESSQSSAPFSQPETRIMYRLHQGEPPALQLDFHSVATYVNTVFDFTPFPSAEESFILEAGQVFGDVAGLTTTVGFDWYQANGSSQDYTYAFAGGLTYTIETDQPGSPAAITQASVEALSQLLDHLSPQMVCGQVVAEGVGVRARLEIEERPSPFFTDSDGYFCRFVGDGEWTLTAWAPFFAKAQLTVSPGDTDVELTLSQDNGDRGIFALVSMEDSDPQGRFPQENWPRRVLDQGGAYSLGSRGRLVVDMGYAVMDGEGAEFQVVEGDVDSNTGEVSLEAAKGPFGPFSFCGEYTGSFSLDLQSCGLNWARYLRLTSESGTAFEARPGYDLDHILALGDSAQTIDADQDGVSADRDCDDTDETISPEAPERCDGVDNNCNARVDETFGFSSTGTILCEDGGVPDTGQDIIDGGEVDSQVDGGDPVESPRGKDGCTCRGAGQSPSAPWNWLLLLAAFIFLGRHLSYE